MDFKTFMAQRKKMESTLATMKKESSGGEDDSSFWYPDRDKSGNGKHLVRLLPQKDPSKPPLVKAHYHRFQYVDPKTRQKKTFREKCLSVKGEKCPICAWTGPLWDGSEADKELARKYYRKKLWIGNVFVIEDTVNPENSKKVFKWRIGAKIFNKIMAKLEPEFAGEDPVNVFDFIDGCDFKVIVKTVGDWANYDDSGFTDRRPLLGGDMEKIEEVFEQIYDLSEYETEGFLSAEELLTKFLAAIGNDSDAAGEGVVSAPPKKEKKKKAATLEEKAAEGLDGEDTFGGNDIKIDDKFTEEFGEDPFTEPPADEEEPAAEQAPAALETEESDDEEDDEAFFKEFFGK